MKKWIVFLSYVLVAAIASGLTLYWNAGNIALGGSKLDQLEQLVGEYFIEDVDQTAIEDAAADAMINALGDRWSYYIPAAEYQAYQDQMANSYVGIGITIAVLEDGTGFEILQVASGGPAEEAGIQVGDVLTEVESQSVSALGVDAAKDMIQGDAGTTVNIAVKRNGERIAFTVMRRQIQMQVAAGAMLENRIGLVSIVNFDSRCADETIGAIEALLDQGAEYLIFDVRFNPGGYKDEMVEVLDYLLPEGPLFRSEDYAGRVQVDKSDADCLEIPMAVLVNGDSYSAAEFFAAALSEYEAAIVVGEPTTGKGYFQSSFELSDGSAVVISIGKYCTPNGNSLAGVGITPDVVEEIDDATAAMVYSGRLAPEEDPQIQAAVKALLAG